MRPFALPARALASALALLLAIPILCDAAVSPSTAGPADLLQARSGERPLLPALAGFPGHPPVPTGLTGEVPHRTPAPRRIGGATQSPSQLDLNDGTWSLLTSFSRATHTAVHDPVRDRMIFVAGYDNRVSNDVWVSTLGSDPEWTRITPAGTPPPERYLHSLIYDPVGDRLILFGGSDLGQFLNDVWELSLSGTPTWTEITPLGTPPDARYGHTAIYDSANARMVVHGGNNGGDLGDVWFLSLGVTPTWSQATPLGTSPGARSYGNAIYDPTRLEMVIFGGLGGVSAQSDVWRLSLTGTPTWTLVAPAGTAPARYLASAIRDPLRDRMLVFGGHDGFAFTDQVWELDLAAPAWTLISPAGTGPERRYSAASIYDPIRDRFVIAGGLGVSFFGDVKALELSAAPAWIDLTPGGFPPSQRSGNVAVYDPLRERLVVFGGNGIDPGLGTLQNLDDTWAFSLDTGLWSELAPAGGPPSARLYASGIYDPVRDRLLVFGGHDGSNLNDLWELSLSGTPTWTEVLATGTPPTPRYFAGAVYDPIRDRMLILGGYDGAILDDVWALDLSSGAWSQLTPIGTPPDPRYGNAVSYDPVRDRLLIFGGTTDGSFSGALNDVWALTLGGSPEWTEVVPSGTPPDPRLFASAIHEPGLDRLVVFGGANSGAALLNDTWELSLAGPPAWVQLQPDGVVPVPRGIHGAVYDAAVGRLLVFGGEYTYVMSDLWALELGAAYPSLAIEDAGTLEGDAATTPLVFTVRLDRAALVPVQVDFLTVADVATPADSDFDPTSGTLVIPVGQDSAAITVDVRGDTQFEADETFGVELSLARHAVMTDSAAIGTIQNDDPEVYTLTVTVVGNGAVSRDPDQATYLVGSPVQLTAIPDAGHHFVAWGGDASGSVNPLDVTMDADRSIVATFEPDASANLCGNSDFESNLSGWVKYGKATLSRVAGGHSGDWAMQVRASSSSSFGADDSPDWIDPVAGPGVTYRYSAWVRSVSNQGRVRLQVYERDPDGDQIGSTGYSNQVTLSPTWQLVTLDFTVRRAGSSLDLRIVNSPRKSKETFLVDDVVIELLPPPVTHTIAASAGPGGSISPSGSTAVLEGEDQTYTITPDFGFHVLDVLVDGGSVGPLTTYTFAGVTADHTIEASFEANPPGANLVGNPSFETDLGGWTKYGSATLSRVAGGHSGGYALEIKASSSSSFGCDDKPDWVPQTAGQGAVYRVSAWVRSESSRGKVKIRIYELDADGDQIGDTEYSDEIPLTASWQLLTAEHVIQRDGSGLSIRVTDAPKVSKESFLVDDVSIELVAPAPAPAVASGTEADPAATEPLEFRAVLAPNPVPGTALLRFATTRSGPLRVRLFDVAGREVRRLVDDRDAAPGRRALDIGARAGGPSEPGVYFYRIEAAEGVLGGRFVVID